MIIAMDGEPQENRREISSPLSRYALQPLFLS